MRTYLIKRVLQMIFTLWVISVVSFIAIQLPPGDFLERHIDLLEQRGTRVNQEMADRLRRYYGLDRSYPEQYWLWITRFVQGDLGDSFLHDRPVRELIGQRLNLTLILGVSILASSWIMALILGTYSALKKYSVSDHILTTLAFFGLATPNFLLALIALVVAVFYFNTGSVTGLFSREFQDAPWSIAKVVDLAQHIWLPVLIIGASGVAGLMRIMRGSLLEVLGQDYILAARARGLTQASVVVRHALKVAINPMITIAGLQIPEIIAGEILVAVVLNLPTTGPLFLEALRHQDMHLAGALLMIMAIMLVLGNFIADLLLAWSDPRISYG
ncbi:ABC transporter permease [Chloroflexi bacterium TSY]|nr:ABC transporter permease [Chloroflexi bacterium TSY]